MKKRIATPFFYSIILIFAATSVGPGCSNLKHANSPEPRQYQIEAGGPQTCIYSSSDLHCWGWNYYSVLGPDGEGRYAAPKELKVNFRNIRQVSLGTNHICLLDETKVFCWGWNNYGQAAEPPSDKVVSPELVKLPAGALQISSRGSHSCALLQDQRVFCWGKNFYGQVAAREIPRLPPTEIAALRAKKVHRLETAYHHSCALGQDGLWCWGWNEMSQLGDQNPSSAARKVLLPNGPVTDFALGAFHTCALIRAKLYCWGRNDLGQLGRADPKIFNTPTEVALPIKAERVFAGYKHTCVGGSGKLYCTGWNAALQLGYKTEREFSAQFREVEFPVGATSKMSAGYIHTCFEENGEFRCWGGNRMGQLGNGALGPSSNPVSVRWKPTH